jgi:DNA-directed RNA polymerase subunit RPC12/RpoP
VPTIFKKCPNCGKRFEVEHTGESVERKSEVVMEEKVISPASLLASPQSPMLGPSVQSPPPVRVAESIEEDEYTETYKCKHCGHVWTEKHDEVEDLGEEKVAGSDH